MVSAVKEKAGWGVGGARRRRRADPRGRSLQTDGRPRPWGGRPLGPGAPMGLCDWTAGSGAKPLVRAPAGGEEKTGEGRGAPGGLEPALLGSAGWGLAQGHGTVRVELGL